LEAKEAQYTAHFTLQSGYRRNDRKNFEASSSPETCNQAVYTSGTIYELGK